MTNIADKFCRENQNSRILCLTNIFPKFVPFMR